MNYPVLDSNLNRVLQEGTVIPAHPLALDARRQFDEKKQRLLTRYYMAAGAGGLAVGVHTTQFEIRKPEINLYEKVLRAASEEMSSTKSNKPLIRVAGIVGPVAQAIKEAEIARKLGYHLGLVSMGGLAESSEKQLVERARDIAKVIPVFGFYLQPAVGGRILSHQFWREFAEIPNVYAIKVAAFNRYQTLDVVRAVCFSGRRDEIALYTGNDDNIVADLITPYRFHVDGKSVEKRFVGGLLGHWSVWTSSAVKLLEEIKSAVMSGNPNCKDLLAANIRITDMNAAIFDVANSFHGCIAGIHEVLRRQGLLEGLWCLNPNETLSPGQLEEINRIYRYYAEYTDDDFVKEFLQREGKIT